MCLRPRRSDEDSATQLPNAVTHSFQNPNRNYYSFIGYTTVSWTLKADLACRQVLHVLSQLDRADGARLAVPRLPTDGMMETQSLVDMKSGYIKRGLKHIPRQGKAGEWRAHQDYPTDLLHFFLWKFASDPALEIL